MMTKHNYEEAAHLVQVATREFGKETGAVVCAAFADFFRADNPRFDDERFKRACQPGANVKARVHELGEAMGVRVARETPRRRSTKRRTTKRRTTARKGRKRARK